MVNKSIIYIYTVCLIISELNHFRNASVEINRLFKQYLQRLAANAKGPDLLKEVDSFFFYLLII